MANTLEHWDILLIEDTTISKWLLLLALVLGVCGEEAGLLASLLLDNISSRAGEQDARLFEVTGGQADTIGVQVAVLEVRGRQGVVTGEQLSREVGGCECRPSGW